MKVINMLHGLRDAVPIDRKTPFGNPFVLGRDGSREEVIEKFRRYFWRRLNIDPAFYRLVSALEGHDLACWCAPKPCHGDVIIAWFEAGKPLKR